MKKKEQETEEQAIERRKKQYGCDGRCYSRIIDPETGDGRYFICGGIDTCDETRMGEVIGTIGAVLFIIFTPIILVAGIAFLVVAAVKGWI